MRFTMHVARRRFLPSILAVAAVGCPTAPVETTPRPRVTAGTLLQAIPNARVPLDGVLSGGQPTPEQIEAVGAAGFRTVINLRAEAEPGFEWEGDAVQRAGMRYVSIPVEGSRGLTRENVERIDAALSEALAAGPTLFHCASGNRIGAAIALRAAWLEDATPEAALKLGLAAGLTQLEPFVRETLGLAKPAGASPAPESPAAAPLRPHDPSP